MAGVKRFPIDHGRGRRIAARLRATGDTPAAELIEQLLDERELIFGSPILASAVTSRRADADQDLARYVETVFRRLHGLPAERQLTPTPDQEDPPA